MADGTDAAWTALRALSPADVSRRAGVCFDAAAGVYRVPCYGQELSVCPDRREIRGESPVAAVLLGKLRYFSELSILRYLVAARDIPLAGTWTRPADLKAGRIFTQGSHVLPLDRLAARYGNDLDAFMARGRSLGAEAARLADASLRLMAFPRVPVLILIWKGCDEFPARADLLFDSSCEHHMPQDIVWATAMMGGLIML